MRFASITTFLLLLPLIGCLVGVICGRAYKRSRMQGKMPPKHKGLKLEVLAGDFTVCKVADYSGVNLTDKYCFIGKTGEENSLVCETSRVPSNTAEREDGWRALRAAGTLDFSLIGILAELSAVLARKQIGIFVVSTYNTDYIFVKKDRFEEAVKALEAAGYPVV
jgi:hypothetical protein